MDNNEILVKCENVSKKFSKDFKRSLIYGLKDVMGVGVSKKNSHHNKLRESEFWAVKDISFELRRGECLGLIGHNGAGKSTLLKMLNGLINPDQGKITMRGRIGALIELGAGFNPLLTGRENIYNNGAILGFTREEIDNKIQAIIDFSEIGDFIDAPVQNYSSGMKVRLGFAVAAQMEPDVLIIDEVLAVGDVGFRLKCFNAIGEIMKNAAVIFVSHAMPQVYRICTSVMLMDHGLNVYHSNIIGKGIDKYFEMFPSGLKQVAGSGDAVVKNIQISSGNQTSNNEEVLTVPFNEHLKVRMEIELNSSVNTALLQLIVWNPELLPVMSLIDENLKGYQLINNKSGKLIVETEIPNINLNAGKHTINVLISSEDYKQYYCRLDNAISFNVSAEFASGAHTIKPIKWQTLS